MVVVTPHGKNDDTTYQYFYIVLDFYELCYGEISCRIASLLNVGIDAPLINGKNFHGHVPVRSGYLINMDTTRTWHSLPANLSIKDHIEFAFSLQPCRYQARHFPEIRKNNHSGPNLASITVPVVRSRCLKHIGN